MADTPFPNLNGAVLTSKNTTYGRRYYVKDIKVTINIGATWDYDMKTDLGANTAIFDLTRTEVEVFVVDQDSGSSTNGFWVSAIGIASVGFKEDGTVRVVNLGSANLQFKIRVFAVLKEV